MRICRAVLRVNQGPSDRGMAILESMEVPQPFRWMILQRGCPLDALAGVLLVEHGEFESVRVRAISHEASSWKVRSVGPVEETCA